MFRGVNTVNLDSKGRLAIPTRYREQLVRLCEGQMVVTVDRDGCLLLYPLPEWEEIERKLARLSSFQKQTRRLQRLLIGHATECEMDANGRILLSQPLREFAGLEKGHTGFRFHPKIPKKKPVGYAGPGMLSKKLWTSWPVLSSHR